MDVAGRGIGPGQPVWCVAELGINHNGALATAKRLIMGAKAAGCDAVKFQKRTIDLCYSASVLAAPRESPWGQTVRAQKEGLEFDDEAYQEIAAYCAAIAIPWFVSVWDVEAVRFVERFHLPVVKIPSALVTHRPVLQAVRAVARPVIMSIGMSGLSEIESAVALLEGVPLALLVCTAAYPCPIEELHLSRLHTLRRLFPNLTYGYSGHEVGLWSTLVAVAHGAQIIERHLTLDRSMPGSDQAASLEPHAMAKLVREIRDVELAMGNGRLERRACEEKSWRKLRQERPECGTE